MQDGKRSLWNPVCLPELPDCYLFPKEIKTFSFAALFFLFLGRPELFDTRRHFCLRRQLNGSRLELGDRRDLPVCVLQGFVETVAQICESSSTELWPQSCKKGFKHFPFEGL